MWFLLVFLVLLVAFVLVLVLVAQCIQQLIRILPRSRAENGGGRENDCPFIVAHSFSFHHLCF